MLTVVADTLLLFKYVIPSPEVSDLVVSWIVRLSSFFPVPVVVHLILKRGILRNSHRCICGGNVLENRCLYPSTTAPTRRT